MKQIFTLIAFFLTISLTSKAQFSENFDNQPSGSIWTLNSTSLLGITDKYLGVLDKNSSFSTPFIQPNGSTTTLNISMTYWFVSLTGNPERSITITTQTGATANVVLVPSLTVNTFSKDIVVPNSSDWQKFTFTFSGLGGNINTVGMDNLVITGMSANTSNSAPAPITLPVKLMNFDAKYNAPNVMLNWSTSQEKNFNHFVIETSSDGINYKELGVVFGAGESEIQRNYSYEHKNMNNKGLIYYRLKSVDNDDKIAYSAVRMIRTEAATKTLSLTAFPNPAVSELRLTIPANWQGKSVKFELYNANGQKVMEMMNGNASQTEVMNVNNINKGMYVVKAICDSETAMQKVMKN